MNSVPLPITVDDPLVCEYDDSILATFLRLHEIKGYCPCEAGPAPVPRALWDRYQLLSAAADLAKQEIEDHLAAMLGETS